MVLVQIIEMNDRDKWVKLREKYKDDKLPYLGNYDNIDHDKFAEGHVIDRGENEVPGTNPQTYEKSDTGFMRVKKGGAYVWKVSGLKYKP